MKYLNQHLIVASHRRSGTHLTIDSIINNFPLFSQSPDIEEVNLDHLMPRVEREKRKTVEDIQNRIELCPCVLKTHTHGQVKQFFNGSQEVDEFISELFDNSKIIYVTRDGRDVLTSLYFYSQLFNEVVQNITFSQFLRMNNDFDEDSYQGDYDRVSYWKYHVSSWLKEPKNNQILLVSFNQLITQPQTVLAEIAEFINQPLNPVFQDLRMGGKKDSTSRCTSVYLRKGKSGDWLENFTQEDLEYFNIIAEEINIKIGNN